MIVKSELGNFYREIRRNIICPSYEKNAFLRDLKRRIDEFCEANPDADIDDVKEAFGEPRAIAEGFESKQDIEALRKYAKREKLYKILIICVIAISVAFLVYLTFILIDEIKALGGDITMTLTIDYRNE